MDEVRPGTTAHDCTAAEIAGLLRPLAEALASPGGLPPVTAWIRQRLIGDDRRSDVFPGANHPSAEERAHALALLDALEGDAAESICHGDVSVGNVLRGCDRLYLVDPRGVIGDVEYDAAVVCIKARLDVRDLALRLQVDVARAEAWVKVAVAARV